MYILCISNLEKYDSVEVFDMNTQSFVPIDCSIEDFIYQNTKEIWGTSIKYHEGYATYSTMIFDKNIFDVNLLLRATLANVVVESWRKEKIRFNNGMFVCENFIIYGSFKYDMYNNRILSNLETKDGVLQINGSSLKYSIYGKENKIEKSYSIGFVKKWNLVPIVYGLGYKDKNWYLCFSNLYGDFEFVPLLNVKLYKPLN